MRWLAIVIVALGLSAADAVRAQDNRPFGITGFALPVANGTVAAAWRHDGKQVVTVDDGNALLFWDAASGRLIDTMMLDGLPPRRAGGRVDLRLSPDGALAAVSGLTSGTSSTTLIVDLVAQKTTATLDRAALFWTPAGLVAGPRAECGETCDFALIDPGTARATSVGIGFGDGRIVAASADGSRFATIVANAGGQALAVWSTATWTPVARAPLPAGEVFDVGFDRAGTRAFARQDGRIVVLDLADGKTATSPLTIQASGSVWATDLDNRRVMTVVGPVQFDAKLMVVTMGRLTFYTADPRYGAIYGFNTGAAAIIGGKPAAANAFPWQVELQYRAPPGGGYSPLVLHNCGGSLIRSGWVLTATHCFLTADNVLRSDTEAKAHTVVRAGSTELDGVMTDFDVTDIFIRRCAARGKDECFHDYDPAGRPPTPPIDDITLLRIVPHVEPNVAHSYTLQKTPAGMIRPIRLPAAGSDVAPPRPVTMTGWGATSAMGGQQRVMSASLNRADLAVVPREACSSHHGFGPLSPTLICAGSADDAQLACKGDSGGPLVTDIDTKKPELVGIVSWGSCNGGPAVYTRVAAFVPWIKATIAAAEAHR